MDSLSVKRMPLRTAKETRTPPVNETPCSAMDLRFSPACWTKPMIFRPMTGKTQGMRLRMRPPKNMPVRMGMSVPALTAVGG